MALPHTKVYRLALAPKKPSIKTDIEETNPALIAQLNQQKLIAA